MLIGRVRDGKKKCSMRSRKMGLHGGRTQTARRTRRPCLSPLPICSVRLVAQVLGYGGCSQGRPRSPSPSPGSTGPCWRAGRESDNQDLISVLWHAVTVGKKMARLLRDRMPSVRGRSGRRPRGLMEVLGRFIRSCRISPGRPQNTSEAAIRDGE